MELSKEEAKKALGRGQSLILRVSGDSPAATAYLTRLGFFSGQKQINSESELINILGLIYGPNGEYLVDYTISDR